MGSPTPPDFAGLISSVARELARRELPFMIIGGHAVLLHGRPRLTEDLDITLGVDPSRLSDIQSVCDTLGLVPLPSDLEQFVRSTFVLPARAESGVRVDFIFSTTPYEGLAIERAVRVELEGVAVPFATAEDLILHKLFAGRPRDLEDVSGIVLRQRGKLDWDYLEQWASEFRTVPGREELPDQVAELRRLPINENT